MKRLNVTSNAFRTVAYDKERQRLEIEFHNGRRYEYHGISPGTHYNLINADSIGTFFHRNIKLNLQYKSRELGPLKESIDKDEEQGT